MPQLDLDQVTKSFGPGAPAVDRLSLHVADGEFLVMVGPSGCGKSTALRMIAGLEEVTSGTIRIGERVVNEIPPRDRDIAMVFQNYALYPHLTVFENLAFGLRRRKVPEAEVLRRVREAAAILGLERYLDRRPRALSGGERQRVALGRAMVREPQVFLFDEPLSNLDARLRVQMRAEIKRLHQRVHATMVYVTHDQVEAMTMGDRIAVLKTGVLQQVADPFTLYREPVNTFVAGFIGSPPINLVRASVPTDGEPSLAFDGHRMRLSAAISARLAAQRGGSVIVGVRPEDLSVASAAGEVFSLPAVVEVCEPLGNETLVYWKSAGGPLVSRQPGLDVPRMGDRAVLVAPFAALRFFDPTTERAIP